MMNIYFAKITVEPSFYVANYDYKSQIIHQGFLSLDQSKAQEWVENRKQQTKVLSSRVAQLSEKKVKSVFMPSETEIQITVELSGSLMTDHQAKRESLSIRDQDITPELLDFAKSFMRKAESKRQAAWKKAQRKNK